MPSRANKLDRALATPPSIPKDLIVQFLTGPMTGEAINVAGIAFKQVAPPPHLRPRFQVKQQFLRAPRSGTTSLGQAAGRFIPSLARPTSGPRHANPEPNAS